MRVSTIIPVYNGEKTIARAIDSAKEQHFSDSEIIVVNDGSTDETSRVLERYGSTIRVINQLNRGPAAARNTGAAVARGRYLAFLDADDEWLPGRLSKSVLSLEKTPNTVLSYCDYFTIEAPEGEPYLTSRGSPRSHREMLEVNVGIVPSIATVRRGPFEDCGGFCEGFLRPSCEDAFLWILLRERGQFEHIPEPLVRYHCQPLTERVLKWEPGRPLFERLLRQRYGSLAKPLIKETRRFFASHLFRAGMHKLDDGVLGEALQLIALAIRIRPSLLSDIRATAFSSKNLRRMGRLTRLCLGK
jgi:glycosyltransferase involved in cell wall biosynthesis